MAENNVSIKFFLFDSLRRYTEKFRIISAVNPYAFELNGVLHSVHASEIHDSGEGRENADEWRIQLQGAIKRKQKEREREGYRVNFIGFFPDGTIFSAWESARVSALSEAGTGSVYIPFSDQERVRRDGAAFRSVRATKIGRDSPEVSLPIEALGFYLENSEVFDSARSMQDLLNLLEVGEGAVFVDHFLGAETLEANVGGSRRRVVVTREAYARDPSFRVRVMEAYGGSCCVCGRQMGLVEAAHIIPHGNDGSNEFVMNGLALCVEHHRLYDSALLIPDIDRKLFLNPDRVEHLRNIGQEVGLEAIRRLAQEQYRIPEHVPSRPSNDFLARGKAIRLG